MTWKHQYIWCPTLNSRACLDTVLQKPWNLDCPRKTGIKWILTNVVLYLLAHQIVYYWNVECYACVHVFMHAGTHLLHWPSHQNNLLGKNKKTGNLCTVEHWHAFMQPLLQWKSNKYYIFWVCFVAFFIQQAMHMCHHTAICGMTSSTIFFLITK